ncbi:Uncharacterized protein SCF082_LOCUS2134 [Durusdinium trenchii]|uniref:Uncharacterized protein n=1 Tax=Durusdinium trenchii TaxID=1381693 RepID=A0ABP0HK94_9DINO
MHRLVCEPCLWVCKDEHGKVQGAVASHVDDFIVTGNEDNALWHETLQKFHQALNWSPWEPDPYLHCGVEIHQQSNYSFHLDHSQYASQIKQIDLDKSTTEVSAAAVIDAKSNARMIDMPYGLTNPEAAEKNDLGAAGATLAMVGGKTQMKAKLPVTVWGQAVHGMSGTWAFDSGGLHSTDYVYKAKSVALFDGEGRS